MFTGLIRQGTKHSMIRLTKVSKKYANSGQEEYALRDCDLTIDAGELVAIVGTSGSGKTTLLNLIGGLDRDYTGSVSVMDRDLAKLSDAELAGFRNREIGFVFQHFNLLDDAAIQKRALLPYLVQGITFGLC